MFLYIELANFDTYPLQLTNNDTRYSKKPSAFIIIIMTLLQVRCAVNKWGADDTSLMPRLTESLSLMPKTVCTFTRLRKMYLMPDGRQDHPPAVTDPESPGAATSVIASQIGM